MRWNSREKERASKVPAQDRVATYRHIGKLSNLLLPPLLHLLLHIVELSVTTMFLLVLVLVVTVLLCLREFIS